MARSRDVRLLRPAAGDQDLPHQAGQRYRLGFFGEVFTTAYVIGDNMRAAKPQQWPLLFNYAFNTVIVAYLIYAKFRYDRRSAPS